MQSGCHSGNFTEGLRQRHENVTRCSPSMQSVPPNSATRAPLLNTGATSRPAARRREQLHQELAFATPTRIADGRRSSS